MKLRSLIMLILMVLSFAVPSMLRADSISKDTLPSYLEALKDNPNDKRLLRDVGFYYLNIRDYAKAQDYAQRLITLGQTTGDRDFCELYGRFILGSAMLDKDPEECFRQLEEARLIADNAGDHEALTSINNSLGIHYLFNHNDLYTSAAYHYAALEEAKAANDERRYGIILSNLVGVYLTMNDLSCGNLAEQSHEIALKRGDPIPLYYAKLALAHYCLLADSIQPLPKLFDEIEQLYIDGGFAGDSNMYLFKAMYAEKKGEKTEAARYFDLARAHFDNVDESFIAATNLAYAQFLRKGGRVRDAITVLEPTLDTIASSSGRVHSPDIVRELINDYAAIGDYRQALDYSMRHQAYQDSVLKLGRERSLIENRIRHEVYANERLIDEQRIELAATRHRLILLAVIIVAVVALLGLTYYNYRRKDLLYRAIVTQNAESIAREQLLREQLQREQLRLQQLEKMGEERAPRPAPTLSEDKADDLMGRFTLLMTDEKLFTDPSITVGAVAEKLGTNRTYLSRAINDSAGKSFTQIVNDYRIREAIALISDTEADMPLKQICSEVGFSSISTFYSTFQAVTGMTPARYRAHVREL